MCSECLLGLVRAEYMCVCFVVRDLGLWRGSVRVSRVGRCLDDDCNAGVCLSVDVEVRLVEM